MISPKTLPDLDVVAIEHLFCFLNRLLIDAAINDRGGAPNVAKREVENSIFGHVVCLPYRREHDSSQSRAPRHRAAASDNLM